MKAITTIRALSSRSNYGSLPRPPAENRIKLYGLYKQAAEGDVEGVMPRPVGFSLEDEGAKKKWDAWKREEGLSRTEAKRQYISFLIETMRVYASGTLEARELLSELEYLWDQIKDLQFSPEDEREIHIPNPPQSPLLLSERYSTATPLPLPSNYSLSYNHQPQQHQQQQQQQLQYRSNLQKIYSHSRRSTMLSLNEYVLQQRQTGNQVGDGVTSGAPPVATSVFSLPPGSLSRHHETGPEQNNSLDDFKVWQGEINMVINKLSREFLNSKASKKYSYRGAHITTTDSENSLDYIEDPRKKIQRRIIHLLKIVGVNILKFFKNFSISILAVLFLTWCIKKNVIVERTIVKQPAMNNRHNKELVINMVLNMDENKWFIRLLNFVNSFVGFV